MSTICHLCTNKITKERFPGIKCGGVCENRFHISCAQISKHLLNDIKRRSASWLCEDCRATANKSIVEDDDDISDSAENINLSDIMIQLKRMDNKLSAFEQLKQNFAVLVSDNIALKSKVQKLEEQILNHNTKLHQIEASIDKPNQLRNSTNLVIRGLPLKHDDARGMIINTFSKIGVAIQTDDIVSIEAVQKATTKNTIQSNKTQNSTRDFFIVKLNSLDIKNNILSQTIKNKNLKTNDLDIILPQYHPHQRIFIMHHLTAFQSKLYREAKIIKINYKYRYLWCKNGQIYLRKIAESEAHRIHSLNDIFRLKQLEDPDEDNASYPDDEEGSKII